MEEKTVKLTQKYFSSRQKLLSMRWMTEEKDKVGDGIGMEWDW